MSTSKGGFCQNSTPEAQKGGPFPPDICAPPSPPGRYYTPHAQLPATTRYLVNGERDHV